VNVARGHQLDTVSPAPAGDTAQRECARGQSCTRPVITINGSERTRTPALTYQPFCPGCETEIAAKLAELPEGWQRMAEGIGDPLTAEVMIRVPFGPSIPLSEYYDALMRATAITLCAWEARVRAQAGLSLRDVFKPINTLEAVTGAAETIGGERLSALLALPPMVMRRTEQFAPGRRDQPGIIPARIEDEYADAEFIALGIDFLAYGAPRSGVDAGHEILHLHRECQRATGEVAGRPEILDGIPCRTCETMGLERAQPPSGQPKCATCSGPIELASGVPGAETWKHLATVASSHEATPKQRMMYSRCPSCHAEMDYPTYRAWVRWYGEWAKTLGPVTCHRCTSGDHGECIYHECACATEEHAAALVASRQGRALICA
jgi:hypothetical protein